MCLKAILFWSYFLPAVCLLAFLEMAGRGDKKSNCLGTLEWTKLSMRFDHLSACRQFYFELYYSQIACLPACTFGMATNVAGSGGKGQNCLWLFICMHGQNCLWVMTIYLPAGSLILPACLHLKSLQAAVEKVKTACDYTCMQAVK